jgi:RNA recognition motif-containing protein
MEKKTNTGIHSVYVGNLSYNRDENGILGLFKQYGFIKGIKLMREGKEDKSKGVAFVDMVNMNDALRAITALDGTLVDGRTLKVSLAATQGFVPKEKDEEVEKPFQLSRKKELGLMKKERRVSKTKGLQVLFDSKKKK